VALLIYIRFAALPKPKETDWELELPEEQQDTPNDVEVSEEDAAERDRRNNTIREAAERLEFKRRTQVMQKALPRPAVLDINSLIKTASTVDDIVEKAIAQEMALLIANDALKYPIPGGTIHGTSRPLETFEDDLLNKARLEIARELPPEDAEKRKEEFEGAWQDVHNHSKVPGSAGYEDDEIDEHQLMVEAFDVCPFAHPPR
jgi:pre-mRNA-splicing factor CDC5/CEF1